jgi:hypothetical protein
MYDVLPPVHPGAGEEVCAGRPAGGEPPAGEVPGRGGLLLGLTIGTSDQYGRFLELRPNSEKRSSD